MRYVSCVPYTSESLNIVSVLMVHKMTFSFTSFNENFKSHYYYCTIRFNNTKLSWNNASLIDLALGYLIHISLEDSSKIRSTTLASVSLGLHVSYWIGFAALYNVWWLVSN